MYFKTEVAKSVPFDNSSNDFTSTDVQSAIEEAKLTATGKIRFTLSFAMNGVVSNGNWITISELIPAHLYILTVNCKMKGISWSNQNANVDFDIEFYKNGTNASNLFRTYQVRNLTYSYENNWNDLFSAGDYIRMKYIDQGDNASDFSGFLWFETV